MYKHILVATDGSDIAERAVRHAATLAKSLNAKLTAVTVTEPFEAVAFTDNMSVINPTDYRMRCDAHAKEILAKAAHHAEAAGTPCETLHQDSHWPYAGVMDAAEKSGADLIVIGSHGRRGLEGLLLGSQAVKLLTHSKTPTLVVR
ncbi:MAG: universal stress protein [Hyphomicrobiaceae bacterium]